MISAQLRCYQTSHSTHFTPSCLCLQLLDSLNSKQHTAAFTRLPSGVKEPWLDPLHPNTLKQPSSSTATNSRTPGLLAISPSDANNKSCEVEWWGNCLGAGSKQLHRSGSADSLAGLSADSEVQLSELEGRSPRSNSTKSPLPLLGELDGPGGQLQTESAESQQSKQPLQQRPLHERGSSPQPGSAEPDTLDGVWHRCGAEQQQQLQQQQQQSCSGSPVVSTRQSTLASFQPCSPVGSSPVSPASDSKGVRRTGGRSLWQQASHLDAWVWWQWRPQDRPFVAAFVQVGVWLWWADEQEVGRMLGEFETCGVGSPLFEALYYTHGKGACCLWSVPGGEAQSVCLLLQKQSSGDWRLVLGMPRSVLLSRHFVMLLYTAGGRDDNLPCGVRMWLPWCAPHQL